MLDIKLVNIDKIDAARKQLRTAIKLWFADEDSVSVHTLACAAHQIIHDINAHRGGRDLLLDTLIIKDEYRNDWIRLIKKDMNFFKHADIDPDGILEFKPVVSHLFILMSIFGLRGLGEKLVKEELVFTYWNYFHNPKWLTTEGQTLLSKFSTEQLDSIRGVSKQEFYEAFMVVHI